MAADDRIATFRAAHVPGRPLVMPNAWDAGSARVMAGLGAAALATTSSGHALTLGRPDGAVTRDEALAHAAALVAAVDVPVTADLENGFADEPDRVAATVREAAATGLAGCSVEDWSRDDRRLYDTPLAVARVAAAVAAAQETSGLVVTARAENLLRGGDDLDDTIARLRAYAAAGADLVYAPGLRDLDAIARVVEAVDRPVNVLVVPGGPTVPELAGAGVARISVGGALAWVAMGAAVDAARELLGPGTTGFLQNVAAAAQGARTALR
jgi:2-methylisocitrate lyase-like PEP mutase family enzyme